MTTKQVSAKEPSFSEVDLPAERDKIVKEIQKIKPKTEVSIEGHSEIAKGQITEWNLPRKLLTVRWDKRSEAFDQVTAAKTGLRAFFKCQLFSTQLVFKTTTVRRFEDGTYHYRIPTLLFKQQSRGALRVPLHADDTLNSSEGKFKIIDLSVTGAKLKTSKKIDLSQLTNCVLNLDGNKIKTEDFQAQITSSRENEFGVRFYGLDEAVKTEIKQFLIDALKVHYEKEW